MKEKQYISRREQAAITKKRIYDTTMVLIHKKGYNKITIREICQNAEISIGTFYLYFLSKDDILLDLYLKMGQKIEASIQELSFENPQDAVSQTIACFFRCLEDAFSTELIKEIYRISIAQSKDILLSPGQMLYHLLVNLLCTEQSEAQAGQLAESILLRLKGYLFHFLTAEGITIADVQDACIQEINKLLL